MSAPAPTIAAVPQAAPAPVPLTAAQLADLTRNVQHLTSADHAVREAALLELSKKREDYPDLAPMLWHSFGTITALLQEIIAIYPALSPPTLSGPASNRVCNALALLQCVASHPETRSLFLAAHIPLYLYPFLNTAARSKPFEYLRLTSLGVIGALVKVRTTAFEAKTIARCDTPAASLCSCCSRRACAAVFRLRGLTVSGACGTRRSCDSKPEPTAAHHTSVNADSHLVA